jgi:hypothetical protein
MMKPKTYTVGQLVEDTSASAHIADFPDLHRIALNAWLTPATYEKYRKAAVGNPGIAGSAMDLRMRICDALGTLDHSGRANAEQLLGEMQDCPFPDIREHVVPYRNRSQIQDSEYATVSVTPLLLTEVHHLYKEAGRAGSEDDHDNANLDFDAYRRSRKDVGPMTRAHVRVNLEYSDKIIKQNFAEWLKLYRAESRIVERDPKRYADVMRHMTSQIFLLFDLHLWAKLRGVKLTQRECVERLAPLRTDEGRDGGDDLRAIPRLRWDMQMVFSYGDAINLMIWSQEHFSD